MGFKEKILLLIFGTLIGVSFGVGAGWILKRYVARPPEGSTFSSTDELRAMMAETDSRDVKPDGSVSLRAIIQPNPSDRIIYNLKPNLNLKFQGVSLRTNSFGLRGRETTYEKPKDVYRIAFLGDSFVFGWGVEVQQSFVSILEERLNERAKSLGYDRVEVLNFGVPGYSTFQEVALFEEEGIKFQPDAVIVYLVENDFGLPFFIKDFSHPEALVSPTGYSGLKDELPADEGERKRKLMKLINPNRSFERLSKLCSEKGIKFFSTINPNRKFDDVLRKVSTLQKLPNSNFLNIRGEVKDRLDKTGLPKTAFTLENDPHPSVLKHEIIGTAIANAMTPLIKNDQPRAAQP